MRIAGVVFACAMAMEVVAQFPLVRALEVRTGQRRPGVQRVVQDAQGLLWVAADAGLLRTDGERVDALLRPEGDRVVALAAGRDAVFAATALGVVVRCTGSRCDTIMTDTTWRAFGVSAMLVDKAGTLWMGTHGNGIVRWSAGKEEHVIGSNGDHDHVNDMDLLPDGRVVLATDQGLVLYDGTRPVKVLGEAQGAPDNLVLSVDVDYDGTIWAGTDRSGVFRWRPDNVGVQVEVLDSAWSYGPVRCLRSTGEFLWAGTKDSGPVVIDRALKRGTYHMPGTIEHAEVRDMLVDSDGALWWCDGSELLHRADPAILVVPEHEGLDLRHITALCSDADDHIWFATADGLYQHVAYFSEERTVTRVPITIDPRSPIVSLAAAPDGTIWAATFGSGVIAVLPDGSTRRYTTKDGLSNDNVLAVRSGIKGMWFATLAGITLHDADGFHTLAADAGFTFDVMEQGNNVFAATDGHGWWNIVDSIRGHEQEGTYYTLVHDDKGALWAAGPGTGFCVVDSGKPLCLGAERPPFDGDLFAVGRSYGRLIAFGSTGVLAFDPASHDLLDVTAMFGLEGATGELNVTTTDRSGALWLGCSAGLVRLRPSTTHFDKNIVTRILSAHVGNEELSLTGTARVRHDQNVLTMRVTGLYYADPGAVRFEYRLVGSNDAPVRTRDREVTIAGLLPGEHTFQVRAFTGEDPGDAAWQEFHLRIAQPWWRTPWAIGAFVVLITTLVVVLVRARERRMRYRDRMEQEKVRFQLEALRSQVDPHFLFNSFNALVELIESDPAVAVTHVEQLSTFFRNILQVRDRERIALKEELQLLENYFELEQRRFGEAIDLVVDVDDKALGRGIVPLTSQLLVENALKHNVVQQGHVFRITVGVQDDALVVHNPLRPRSSSPRSTGFGLESITKRYGALTHRPVVVERTRTEFIVRIPLIDP